MGQSIIPAIVKSKFTSNKEIKFTATKFTGRIEDIIRLDPTDQTGPSETPVI